MHACEQLGVAGQLRVPALHHHPREAIAQCEQAIAELGAPLLIGSSLVVFLVGLVVSRLPGSRAGPLVALLAGAAATAAVLFPQPAAQIAGAAQPGLAALVVVLVGLAAGRWYYRHRVTYLPGFSRSWADHPITPSTPSGTPSVRQRPEAPLAEKVQRNQRPKTGGR